MGEQHTNEQKSKKREKFRSFKLSQVAAEIVIPLVGSSLGTRYPHNSHYQLLKNMN